MNKVKWGIIGCGDVTEVKSGPAFQQAQGSELVAVMRRDLRLAEDYARRHNVAKWYNEGDDLINDPDVNTIYVATPPSTHKEYTIKAALAGKPVYVEKPMAMNYAECLEMIEVCKHHEVPLFVAYYRRALPRFVFIRKQLEAGIIGDIRTVNIRFRQIATKKDHDPNNWRIDPKIAGCGYFCDLASHMLDLLQYYLGPVSDVNGFAVNLAKIYTVEDTVNASILFESGALATGEWSFCASENLDQTELCGTKGKISYSVFEQAPVIIEVADDVKKYSIAHPKHIQQPLIQNIVDELLGKGKSPSTGEGAASTNFIMDRILNKQ